MPTRKISNNPLIDWEIRHYPKKLRQYELTALMLAGSSHDVTDCIEHAAISLKPTPRTPSPAKRQIPVIGFSRRHAQLISRWAMLCQAALVTPEKRQPVLMQNLTALFHSSIVVIANPGSDVCRGLLHDTCEQILSPCL